MKLRVVAKHAMATNVTQVVIVHDLNVHGEVISREWCVMSPYLAVHEEKVRADLMVHRFNVHEELLNAAQELLESTWDMPSELHVHVPCGFSRLKEAVEKAKEPHG